LINFEKSNDQVIIKINKSKLDQLLAEEIFSKIEKPVSHVKIFYDEKGQIQFEGKALKGIEIDREKFIKDLELALNSIGQEVEITTVEKKPDLIIDEKLQEIGIKELISTGHTAFAGSPNNRRHNIATAMAKFNGLIIKPGETFSFNDNLGEVDGSTGYKLELVIKAEGTVPEYGGGVCQVSSTVFKAGLLSGLPIVERAPHSYAVGYYAQVDGYGLDSTIYPGVRDLKFTNNTPAAILIQTFIDESDAYVNFYGTSDGRQVKLENYWRGNYRGAGGTQLIPTKTLPPGAKKQIESAHGGFDASWERVITDATGQETREKIYSVYRATANRILVGEE
ncbi:VanW family protein, partial [Candidatus Peregrinibacteria bacterium]|nr:VanW family protein [Candidatus Peregrinibacteria bacterium]